RSTAMATTHTARRRPRPARRTTTSSAHVRAHRGGARQNRATVAQALAPAIAPVVVADTAPVKAAAKPMRTPDADDHLAPYFRQLAEHELLTPEDDRELSQGIEDTEILTWERVFARADVVHPLLTMVEPNLETPVKFPRLVKQAEEMLKT